MVTYPYIIAGAGCAGLSLVWHLLDAGIRDPILLLDSRTQYVDDRTWCYWRVEPTPFDDLADHAWNAWEVRAHPDLVAVGESAEFPYLHLRSEAFYRRVLARIAASPQVTLRIGETIRGYRRLHDGVEIQTETGAYRGRTVFDSAGLLRRSQPSDQRGVWLQHFLGQRIRANRPVFAQERLTLMDHRVSQAHGPHFIYLLPYSESMALIENTYFFRADLSLAHHRAEIARYLERYYGLGAGEYEVVGEEKGKIPMGEDGLRPSRDERIIPIGISGGAARAATGYAFLRIQRQSREIAERIVGGRRLALAWRAFGAAKYKLFDRILLEALSTSPELAPLFFATLFERARPGSVIRFLTERSHLFDDGRIIAALFKPEFLRMILRPPATGMRSIFADTQLARLFAVQDRPSVAVSTMVQAGPNGMPDTGSRAYPDKS